MGARSPGGRRARRRSVRCSTPEPSSRVPSGPPCPVAIRRSSVRRRPGAATWSRSCRSWLPDALRDADRSPDPHLEDIRGTLEAASVDEEIGERLRTGTLERTSRPSAGFGDISGLQLVSRRDDTPGMPEAAPAAETRSARVGDAEHARELAAQIRRLTARSRSRGTEVGRRRRGSRSDGGAGGVDAVPARRRAGETPRRGVFGIGAADDREAGRQALDAAERKAKPGRA